MACKKRFGDGVKGNVVFWVKEAMALVRKNHVGHGNTLGPHGGDDLIRLRHLATYVVGAMADQHRLRYIPSAMQWGARAKECAAFLGSGITDPQALLLVPVCPV